MTVYVCAERDIECGWNPASWCSTCPQRTSAMPAPPSASAERDMCMRCRFSGEVEFCSHQSAAPVAPGQAPQTEVFQVSHGGDDKAWFDVPKGREHQFVGWESRTLYTAPIPAPSGQDIPTWQERMKDDPRTYAQDVAMKDEIAALRAALAAASTKSEKK